ncbi:PhzF family phenazine biosynthesis protein [Rhodococcoides yunnanense]|uniref:PhzF family phenazine biosynthesis protein n=1 Tax=Rhodococcoides yunnanense TaxID=278209 RepID=A0ABU4B6Y6_9NOCA|nr:PhzF family phenazine biosynthesis protein [Rhodococcus yunnanensis]MDV6259952.1 PhzF family phenazine biosynthesis protein [Rhodococcus yunnanensis]
MTTTRRFAQVDVFASAPISGNPVAVVLDATDLDDQQMAAFARWTNLSETTFVLPPTDPDADYRLRIFTPGGELPFAGHPTLGSAHAWLESGGHPRGDNIIQQCAAGLITIRRDGERLAFAAPPLGRSGPVNEDTLLEIRAALGLQLSDVVASNWVDTGSNWIGLVLTSGERVLSVQPDFTALGDHHVGLIGAYRNDPHYVDRVDYEVRAFAPGVGTPEDPVTGSLNAGFATWLRSEHEIPEHYVVAQGTALGRAGRLYVDDDGERIWVGGVSVTTITGSISL